MQLLEISEPGQTPLPHVEKRELAVGIDLGTTNSLIAISEGGKPEVLRDADGRVLLPSAVAYGPGEPVVGQAARDMLLAAPERVAVSIKRLMGRGIGDLKAVAGTLPFQVEAAEAERMVRLVVGGRKLTPVEISADILRALKARAEAALGRPVTQAVVTVPAYFDDAARTATRDAARLAGLQVLRLVNEPTAAALAYGLDRGAEGLYAVYDLGGGTFDVSVLRLEKGVFQVLATGGDAALGGDDFDHALAEHFLSQRGEAGNPPPLSVAETKQLLALAREAKERLTTESEGELEIVAGGVTSQHRIDRAGFEALIAPFVERTTKTAATVLADAGLGVEEIKGVVLVGGATRVPLVRRRVGELFGRAPLGDIDPDQVVALGAALQAEALTRGGDTLLLDVVPLSLGIETMGGLVEKVIPRNTPIPAARAQEFTTYRDGQSAMAVHVVQGERELAPQNRSLARFELHDIPPMTAGAARIRVTFAVDADGLLSVTAEEATTGVRQTVEVKPSYGLSEDEMTEMLRQSMEHAAEDMTARLLTEAKVEAERVLFALDAALKSDGDLLSAAARGDIETAVAAVRRTLQGEDRDAIAAAVEALDKATVEFAGQRMDRGMQNALRGVNIDRLADRFDQ